MFSYEHNVWLMINANNLFVISIIPKNLAFKKKSRGKPLLGFKRTRIWSRTSTVSQLRHYGNLGSGNSLLWGLPVHGRRFRKDIEVLDRWYESVSNLWHS